jgi:hypothetical protein
MMKSKIAVIAAVIFVFGSIEAFSIGIGLRGNFGYGNISGGGLLISLNDNTHFGGNYYIDSNSFHLGVTGDLWLLNGELTDVGSGALNYYVGGGLFAQMHIYSNEDDGEFGLGAGVRVPVGLDLKFDIADIFLEFAPQIGVKVLPSIGLYGGWFNAAIGFRIWIE